MFHFAGFNLFGAPSELGRLDLMGDRVDIHTPTNSSQQLYLQPMHVNTTNGAIVLAYLLNT